MRYRANKKVSRRRRHRRWRRRQQDPHQKQYAPLPFGGGHKNFNTVKISFCKVAVLIIKFAIKDVKINKNVNKMATLP